jgi:hypothetical protein
MYIQGKNNIIYLKALNMFKKNENNLYDNIKSQQLYFIVDENHVNEEKKMTRNDVY